MEIKMKRTPAQLGRWRKRYVGYSSGPEKRRDWSPSDGGATIGTLSPKSALLGAADGDHLKTWLTARLTAREPLPDFFEVFAAGRGRVLAEEIFEVV